MVITFSCILFVLLALIRPLQRNPFYFLHMLLVIGSAYYIEHHYFTTSIFSKKTVMLFLIFHIISINLVTIVAYFIDKKAAIKHRQRIRELDLHTLELFGGWLGAYIAQRLFNHKTKKKEYQFAFKMMGLGEIFLLIYLWQYLF